jgi:imidazolonepropionase-like amidohydrolase
MAIERAGFAGGRGALRGALAVASLLAACHAAAPATVRMETAAGDVPRLAFRSAKVLTAERRGDGFIDNGVVLVRGSRIEAVGAASELAIPPDYELIDVGERWIMPGMIDLHTHIAGSPRSNDINDMVLQTNEGLRASTSVVPGAELLRRDVEAGITTVLYIPGSGTNIGGQGILLKTGLPTFEEMRVRDPGSLKIAQGDNPTRWGYGMGRSMMNFHIRGTVRRGLGYAKQWEAFESGHGAKPQRNVQFDVFRDLGAKRTQVSTHTQIYQLVLTTLTMLKGEFGLDVYIDHGEWQGFLTAPLAKKLGVSAICGPREIDAPGGRFDFDGKILSVAGSYQERGLEQIGFNTDAPVVPGEELPLQAAMGVRYGFDNSRMDAVRGLTIIPAQTAGIADRVGSLEPGKDADLIVISGDPADPRCAVDRVWIEGRLVYAASSGDRQSEVRRW